MSSWKKSWDHKNKEEVVSNDDIMVSAMKKKMKKIIKKRENPKNIPEFEDLYDRPQMSNVVEGFHVNEYLEDVKRKVDKKKTPVGIISIVDSLFVENTLYILLFLINLFDTKSETDLNSLIRSFIIMYGFPPITPL